MLAKKNRLSNLQNKKDDFFKSEYFDLKIFKSQAGEPKFAFVISKKISKSAVLRNKTKRLWAQAIRINLGEIAQKEVILIVKKLFDQGDAQAQKIIKEEFKKAKIIK